MPASARTIPALINAASGTADDAREALEAHALFDLREVQPDDLDGAFREAAEQGAARVLVAGGDGTIASAASALIGTTTELAILPGGTLNHFATDLGIPTDRTEALDLAATGTARPADVGMVNERVFLNTASVGAYVHFVRTREYLEKRFGYRIASFLAAVRVLFQLRLVAVEVEVDGQRRIYRTPIVFIGVGERELQLPTLGNRKADGKRGLHVMIVRGRSAGRLMVLALSAVARGVKEVSRTPELDSFIVESCSIKLNRRSTIGVDGELMPVDHTTEFVLKRDALQVVCP